MNNISLAIAIYLSPRLPTSYTDSGADPNTNRYPYANADPYACSHTCSNSGLSSISQFYWFGYLESYPRVHSDNTRGLEPNEIFRCAMGCRWAWYRFRKFGYVLDLWIH